MVATRSRLAAFVASLSLVAGGLLLGTSGPSQAVPGAFTFAGTGFGAIPDGGSCQGFPGTVLNVTFDVTGLPPGPPSDVRVTGLSLTHARVGDVAAALIAPNGDVHVLFGRTGVGPGDTSSGDSSNLVGPYSFSDDALGNWWTSASTADPDTAIPSGAYRTSAFGTTESAGAVSSITPAFSGVTNPNGTWTLRFYDFCAGDIGTVTAATLEIAPKCAPLETAVGAGQTKVASANAALTAATTAAAAADQRVQAAVAVSATAKKKLAKATKALAKAEMAQDEGKIQKAKKKLSKAKKARKAAQAALASRQEDAVKARQNLTGAQTAVIAAQADLIAAQSALASCKG